MTGISPADWTARQLANVCRPYGGRTHSTRLPGAGSPSVPGDAVLLKDNRIALPDPGRDKHAARAGIIPQKVIARRYAADFGPLDQLKQSAVTHVIVSESDYGRYFRGSLRPQKGEEGKFAKSREFYERLFKEAQLLEEWDRGTVIYLHPGIRVYRLR